MSIPTITTPQQHFFPIVYEGNGLGQRVGKFLPYSDNGTIANSCLFENNVHTYLSRTLSSSGSATKCTFSCWVKRDILSQGLIGSLIMMHSDVSANGEVLTFDASDRLYYYEVTTGTRKWNFATVRTFEDTSRWYHIMVARDTTLGNQDDRVKIYVDGELLTDDDFEDGSGTLDLVKPAQDATGYWNQTGLDAVVGNTNNGSYIDGAGYLAEVNMVDGAQLSPSTFGLTDTSTGRWIPKTLSGITYGTNGFRLQFSGFPAIGDDTSGNNNDFTNSSLTAANKTTDSPTQNHFTLDPGRTAGSPTLSGGNLSITSPGGNYGKALTGKFFNSNISSGLYWEYSDGSTNGFEGGIIKTSKGKPQTSEGETDGIILQRRGSGGGNTYWIKRNDSQYTDTGVSHASGDKIGVAVKDNKIWFAVNNNWVLSGNPASGTNPAYRLDDTTYMAMLGCYGSTTVTANFGQKTFNYTPPTGFSGLQQDNLSGTSRGIPDLVFLRDFDTAVNWQSYDSTRGARLYLLPSTAGAETYIGDSLQKFLKGGFSVEDNTSVNAAGKSNIAHSWVANNGVLGANTDGSGSALSCNFQTNQDAGFSIVKFQGNGGQTAVEHGLSQAPEFIIQRRRDNGGSDWFCYTTKLVIGSYYNNKLNGAVNWAVQSNGSAPTNKVFTSHGWGSDNMIAYCWHSVPGYSYFGSYLGDANSDGPFIHLDFEPAMFWIKAATTANWYIYDNQRSPRNPTDERLVFTNAVQSTNSGRGFDICSNGIKVRQESGYGGNYNNTNIFIAAWAEHPFLGSGSKSPLTAR